MQVFCGIRLRTRPCGAVYGERFAFPGASIEMSPSLECVSKAPPIFLEIRGNPRFKPEVLISWQAGYRQLLTPKFFFDLALFHNQYDDLATTGILPCYRVFRLSRFPTNIFTATYANGAKGVTDGLEFAPDWKPFPWLDLRGTYSHLHMDLHSESGIWQSVLHFSASYEGSSPNHMGQPHKACSLCRYGIEIDPDYRYMSALPAMKIPAYQTADAHIAWKIKKTLSTHRWMAVTCCSHRT